MSSDEMKKPSFDLFSTCSLSSAKAKNYVMEEYAAHHIDVLVSTTVIEVGINVPNATVMLVEKHNIHGPRLWTPCRGYRHRTASRHTPAHPAGSRHPDKYRPMPFMIDGETYYEEITLSQEEFYQRLAQNADISTSLPIIHATVEPCHSH